MIKRYINNTSSALLIFLFFVPYLFVSAQENDLIKGIKISPIARKIIKIQDYLVKNGKLVNNLTKDDLTDLPVGIVKEIAGKQYVIAIDSAYQTSQGIWLLSAYTALTIPGATRPTAFRASGVAFGPEGLAGASTIKLQLVSDEEIVLGDYLTLELPGNDNNYVEFDCNGFKSINLKGNFLFSKDIIEPVKDPSFLNHPSGKVSATFEVNASSLNDILLSVNITPFHLKGVKDFSFVVQKATVDMSDIANPPDFTFPQDYRQTLGGNINLWRGFYLKELKITYNFSDSTGKTSPTFQAKNVLIDDSGVSGYFSAKNLIAIGNGSAGGWPISVNSLSATLLRNRLVGAGIEGAINVPFLGNDTLNYSAQLEQVADHINYKFLIATESKIEFPSALGCKIILTKNSSVTLEKKEGRLSATAILNGNMNVDQKIFKVKGIEFENLTLTTEKPYIKGGYFSLGGGFEQKLSGFSISINEIKFGVVEAKALLSFTLKLNIMNSEDKSSSVSTSLSLSAKNENKTRDNGEVVQKWVFDKLKLNEIDININTQAFKIAGKLAIYDDDPIYGNGFGGGVAFEFIPIKLKAGATVYFGCVRGMRYWHLDVFAMFQPSIPIVYVLKLSGLQGGMSYHMKRYDFKPDFTALAKGDQSTTQADNLTGMGKILTYVPDSTISLSLLAGIALDIVSAKVLTANALFEVAFREGGGLKFIRFDGEACFFVKDKASVAKNVSTTPGSVPEQKSSIVANLLMYFDNDNKVFYANLKARVNIYNVVKGIGPNNLAGEVIIYVGPSDWYLYVGRPSNMIGVEVLNFVRASAYFMVGTKVEGLPLPPSKLMEILGENSASRSQNPMAMATGRGVGFGARLEVGKEFTLTPFYASIFVGGGFDFLLTDFGTGAYCKGSNPPLGIEGWYAQGQAYIYMEGKVGVKIAGGNFDILSLGLGALLEAKGPNPTWMQGQAAGSFKLLGGFVKGSFHLKFQFGHECELVTNGKEIEVVVIGDVKPANLAKEISVFAAPQVAFNIAIDEEFSMENNFKQTCTYRVVTDEFVLTQNNLPLNGDIVWNSTKESAVIKTFETLPAQSELKVSVKIHWQKKLNNSIWEDIKNLNSGRVDYETKQVVFTTGLAPDFIPDENVAYSYPIKMQYNFYNKESDKGYVQLKQGQSYLFENKPDQPAWKFLARFQGINGSINDVNLTYDANVKRVNFALPQNLPAETIHKLIFLRVPQSTTDINENVDKKEDLVNAGNDNNVTVTSVSLKGNFIQGAEKDIYNSAFRTSKYSSFNDKITSFSGENNLFIPNINNTLTLAQRNNTDETFDNFELGENVAEECKLVQLYVGTDNDWYKNEIYPLVYEDYDKSGLTLTNRAPLEKLGVPPLKAVKLFTDEGRTSYQLEESDITSGTTSRKTGTVTVEYYFSFYAFNDYAELRNKAGGLAIAGKSGYEKLLSYNTVYPGLKAGRYPVILKYVLPGDDKNKIITTQKTINIRF